MQKVYIDSNVADWLLADRDALSEVSRAARLGRVVLVLTPEVAYEVANAANDGADALRACLHTAGAIEVLDVAASVRRDGRPQLNAFGIRRRCRAGFCAARAPGVKGLDSTHVLNAVREQCDVLLTNDRRLRNKEPHMQRLTQTKLQILAPQEWLANLGAFD
jgi:PIN domain